jgi:hypothetical protein
MPNDEKAQRVSLAGVDPVEALRALLKVDPDSEPAKPAERDHAPAKPETNSD